MRTTNYSRYYPFGCWITRDARATRWPEFTQKAEVHIIYHLEQRYCTILIAGLVVWCVVSVCTPNTISPKDT